MSGELLAFHHVSRSVSDPERSAAWYQQVLGLQSAAQMPDAGFRRTGLRSAGDGVTSTCTARDPATGSTSAELLQPRLAVER